VAVVRLIFITITLACLIALATRSPQAELDAELDRAWAEARQYIGE
jgi:hypothetical protein